MYSRLSALDRSFLDLESANTHMHVAGCFIFEAAPLARPEGGLDIDRVRSHVLSRLHRMPRYRQRIERIPIENHPVWVDDARFNVHYHVRHTALPAPGDDHQLKRLCGRILSQQLDRGKPLWEIWLVEGLEHERVALISKVHHCMVDGISGAELLQELLSLTPEKRVDDPPRWLPSPAPGPARLLADAMLRRFELPLRAGRAVARAIQQPEVVYEEVRDALTGVAESVSAGLRPAGATPLNEPVGPHRSFDWVGFDLDEVKRVKNQLGGTVNDVVLATVAGAVGRFLEQRGVEPRKLRDLDFRAFCPVSVRSAADRGTLGNRVSSMVVPLPIAEPGALERLEAVRRTTRDVKQSKQALGAEVLSSVSEWTVPTLISLAARLGFSSAANLVVTNVPGPQIPLYLLGARMLEAYPMAPLFERQGLSIALISYAGGLFWGVNADWDQFPDLHDFLIAIDASFRQLCEAAEEPAART
jgi:WS/DGAT/MGAT family acyltransferase